MITSEFDCPTCGNKRSVDIGEVYKYFGKKLHFCSKCETQFVVEHKAVVTTSVFTIEPITPK